ncbi:MAG: hypothetical protein WC562_08430 [Dehalococcoidia bacterium]
MSHWKGAKYKGDNFEQGADGAFNVSWQVCYCDKDYILEEYKERRTAPDGRLVIAELRNKEGVPPSFLFRWDEKDDHLNVDINGVTNTIAESFKKGKGGYKGHCPKRRKSENTTFEVDIRILDKQIFHGYVKFNINHMAKSATSMGLAVSASYKFTSRKEATS